MTQQHTIEARRYAECGLNNVYVTGGMSVNSDTNKLDIADKTALHNTITRAVITKRGRLRAAEIRYLRKALGLTSAEFAAFLDTPHERILDIEESCDRLRPDEDARLREAARCKALPNELVMTIGQFRTLYEKRHPIGFTINIVYSERRGYQLQKK